MSVVGPPGGRRVVIYIYIYTETETKRENLYIVIANGTAFLNAIEGRLLLLTMHFAIIQGGRTMQGQTSQECPKFA